MHQGLTDARILIVDDELVNLALMQRLLGRHGYRALHVLSDPREVLAAVSELDPDLILLDMHMPWLSGLDVLRGLRAAQPPESYQPVLILTADITEATRRDGLDAGANDFLTKPFDATEVLLRVRNLLETRLLHVRMESQVRSRTLALAQAQIEILERLSAAAEFRDDDTGQHTKRVGVMCARVAEVLGLSGAEIDVVRHVAPLHDLGKIGIPDAVLLKPGRLTPPEWEMMKSHTIRGAEILAGSQSPLLQMAERIALSHHERWDGTGYPDGLRGEEIPLAARIVSVVDVHDALSHDRPYRTAWAPEDVRSEIESGRGSHFDPVVADALLSLLAQDYGSSSFSI